MNGVSRRTLLSLGGAMALNACRTESAEALSLRWSRLPDLPQALGGQMAGVHNGVLLVAGGSYFETPPWAGGLKLWVDTVYVLTAPDAFWQTFHLPVSMGYAASASAPEGLFLLGGGDSAANRREVLRLRWNGSSVDAEPVAPLPVPLANGGAGYLRGKAYVVGGQESPTAATASAALYSLEVAQPDSTWRREAPLPGSGRILPAVAVVGDHLYVASGASLRPDSAGKPARTYLRDAWRFHPDTGWEPLPKLPRATVAASAHGLGSRFLVFGGDDGRYAAQPDLRERHPGFPRDVLAFDTQSLAWQVLPEMPAGLVTTTATLWQGQVIIPGGEDRPAHRSAAVYACRTKEASA